MKTYLIYLDVPLLSACFSSLQDMALLYTVTCINACQIRFSRLLLGGILGGILQFFFALAEESNGKIATWAMYPPIYLLLWPVLILIVGVGKCSVHKFRRCFITFYVLSFLMSGIQWGLDMLNLRFFRQNFSLLPRFVLHLLILYCFGQFVWKFVNQRIWEMRCIYPITLKWNNYEVNLKAFLDTGNCLSDPLTLKSVVIVEYAELKPFFSNEVNFFIDNLLLNNTIETELSSDWQKRFRLLPFHAVGCENGLLIGFRPDSLKVLKNGGEFIIENPIIGLQQSQLSSDKEYQALISPTLFEG